MIGALSWNVIWVYDVEKMTDWYANVLGLRVDYRAETATAFDTGACVLVLIGRHDNGPVQDPGTRGWERNHVLFTFKVYDMDETLADLATRGAVPLHVAPVVIDEIAVPRWRIAQIMDPEGNIIELCDEPVRWNPGIGA
jgi:predicted enzyme related to lactoylglutathione lyase